VNQCEAGNGSARLHEIAAGMVDHAKLSIC
jgi:hypothetical protein